ncbi:MAG: DUF6442 family protein [Bifidobacterium sp.]|jgi:hypothetical protein|nr:DUF6442 family protein [Bifidobacterium sp.]MCH4175681.1 DUF6442 family protein [Bifidobacterium sp.]
MDRNETLSRSRKEDNDEGFLHSGDRGRYAGELAFAAAFIIINGFNLVRGVDVTYTLPLWALFFAFLSVKWMPLYRFTRSVRYLALSIVTLILAAGFIVAYMIGVTA